MKRFCIFFFLLLFPLSVEAKEKVSLKECIDGDTVKFQINEETVTARFLAIDTPEIKHGNQEEQPYGKEASEYTCNALTNAKKITIEYDENSEQKDKYDRILVWVFVDDTLLQEDLVKKGYAKVAYLYGDYKYTKTLQEKELQAKQKQLRIWSSEKSDLEFNDTVTLLITIGLLIIGIIMFLTNKSYRKKKIAKVKKTIENEVEKKIKEKV